MPNKYEREIEEILRNMERTEPPRAGLSDRIRAFNRPRPRPQRGWQGSINASESLFVLSILLALAAASVTFYFGLDRVVIVRLPVIEDVTLNGILALGAFIALVAALFRGWRERFRLSSSTPAWRGNVIEMRPARRNPLSALVTQFRIFRLKFRYWRTRGKE